MKETILTKSNKVKDFTLDIDKMIGDFREEENIRKNQADIKL